MGGEYLFIRAKSSGTVVPFSEQEPVRTRCASAFARSTGEAVAYAMFVEMAWIAVALAWTLDARMDPTILLRNLVAERLVGYRSDMHHQAQVEHACRSLG
jgi:hypothetical protein